MTNSLSTALSYEWAMGKMRFILPLLLITTVGLYLQDRSWDRQWFLWINTGIPRALPDSLLPMWNTIMYNLTYLGDTHVMMWIILFVYLPWWIAVGRKTPEKLSLHLVVFAIVVVLATVASQSLKQIVGDLRPAGVLPPESLHILGKALYYHSFPSGHTVTVFASMCFLLPILPVTWRWGALILAAGIGFSRIGVGAHWPIDVSAGAFLGIVAGMMGWQIAFWLQKKGLAENLSWKKLNQGLAMLGGFIMATNVAYTPFFEWSTAPSGLIGLCLTLALLLGYYQRGRSE